MSPEIASKTIKSINHLAKNLDDSEPFVEFVRMARNNGMDTVQAQMIARICHSDARSRPELNLLARAYLARVNEKIQDLRSNRVLLEHLAGTCYGDDRSYCPILIALALCPGTSTSL